MKIKNWPILAAILLVLTFPGYTYAQLRTTPDLPIQISQDGKLTYKADVKGDRVPDFSYCGYMLSEVPIPDVPVKVIVPAMKGDATAKIQTAIDYVSSLPLDKRGFRGTVLLEKGTFEVAGSLTIRASGVVVRGSGSNSDGTILMGTGADRETLIRITGVNNQKIEKPVPLADTYFPVNSTKLTFKKGHPFKVGDPIIVNRPSTKEWLEKTGADKIGIYVDYPLTKWEPGDFDQNWYRNVIAISPESITIDVPLTNALDPQYGGGNVAKYIWQGQIRNVGVENLRCISTFDSSNAKDENHRWMAITMDNVRDAWVRRVVAEHFVSSAVAVWEKASRITVEDCKSLAPVGEIGNYRRWSFHTLGQQVLFQRCYAEYGYHAFSVGFTASGPNAFVQCYSYMPTNFSGAIGGWASGVLFDKTTVDGGIISFAYRDVDEQGGGWSAANSLCWQCRA
ncbi:MAG: pectate lyase, partial [Flavisolibacter sp.]|nr:pectate lyase [Flavisolibacter sp.]